MKLDNYVVVSGMSGVHEIVTSRNNGIVIKHIDSGKSTFCSVRKHQFTPLSTVGIYTLEDTEDLKTVFTKMLTLIEKTPPVATTAPKHEIEEYFEQIIPEYDEDKVYVSDMKKVIKWFNYLNERKLLSLEDEDSEDAKSEEE